MSNPSDTSANLTAVLQQVRPLFNAVVVQLAQRCADSSGQRLDSVRLDNNQPATFELAWAAAHLLAAENLAQHGRLLGAELPAALSRLFAVDAITDVFARLEALLLELGAPAAPLQAIRLSADWQAAQSATVTTTPLTALGQRIADGAEGLGEVPLDETLTLAQDSFRRFAQEVVAPQAETIHREDRTVPESLLQPLRELGVFGLGIPESYGGHAIDEANATLLMVVVTEALSEASLAAAGSLITRPEILSRALLAGGTEAQKRHWLPRIAAGAPLCAISITEPDHGSDVASLALRATRTSGGWLLNGAKTWCTLAGKAELLMVVARTEADPALGHRGLSLMLVEKPAYDGHHFETQQPGGGRLVGRAIPTIGYRGMHSFDLAFDNFFVPADHLIGEAAGEGKGFYFTMSGMVGGRIQTAGRACGVMRAALKAGVQYARDRVVFGAPLASYSLTQAKLARMAARLQGCRELSYAVARDLDRGGDRATASLVKLLACRSAEWVTREALQLHGGMGYAEESAVSRYFVDARVLSIFEGAEETLALKVIGRGLLEAALLPPQQPA